MHCPDAFTTTYGRVTMQVWSIFNDCTQELRFLVDDLCAIYRISRGMISAFPIVS
jgi:hypothetical protein